MSVKSLSQMMARSDAQVRWPGQVAISLVFGTLAKKLVFAILQLILAIWNVFGTFTKTGASGHVARATMQLATAIWNV